MASLKINVANILDIDPGPIRCLTLNENTLKLALFRGGKYPAIEIWDVSHIPFMEKVLTDLEKMVGQASVESMVWSNNRLFSCGLHGFVLEHDIVGLKIKGRTAATSGPVWCLGVNSNDTYIAAGTEDGFVNIFQVLEEGLIYLKVLDRQEGRVLCLNWSPCGKFIATGSIDSIRVWDVEKGHALQRLMTGRSKNTETIVWSILMLDDFLIVSGDSRGIISFWDGRVGVLRHKTNTHKADILTLKLSSDKSAIYAAGVDPTVVLLTRMGRSGDKWVKSHQRIMHTNDVMCLATHGNRLFSAGIDADLVVSSFPPKVVTKYPPLPKSNRICLSSGGNQILIQTPNGIDIWRLPNEKYELVKLLELKSRKEDTVESACQSPTGNFFAYSTLSRINFFRLSTLPNERIPKLLKLKRVCDNANEEEGRIFPFLHFVGEKNVLALSTDGRTILFWEIDETSETVSVSTTKSKNPLLKAELKDFGGVCLSEMSPSGQALAIANCNGGILTFQVDCTQQIVKVGSRLPTYRHQATSFAFHPTKSWLLLTYLDHSVKVWNYETHNMMYSDKVTNAIELYPILSCKWSSDGKMVSLTQIDKIYLLKVMEHKSLPLVKRIRSSNIIEPTSRESMDLIMTSNRAKYKFVSFVDFNERNELVMVEVKPNSLIEKLPPAFAKKRFGM